MADRYRDHGRAVLAHFHAQAQACDRLGSPFTAGLCRALASVLQGDTATGKRVLIWPGDPREDALALRLCAALHSLVLTHSDRVLAAAFPPRSASEFILAGLLPGVIDRHDERLAGALEHPPQTNEIGRAAMLLPGFLTVARETGLPLDLTEIGASAGLNSMFERFGYRYGETRWGDAGSPVQLVPEVRGRAVPLEGGLEIRRREASDRKPVNIGDPGALLRLRSFVWPDQQDRLERLDAAVKLAGISRVQVRQTDAADAVLGMLSRQRDGAASVLFHSILWQYLPEDTRAEISDALNAAGQEATPQRPLAWLRLEPLRMTDSHATLYLTSWPGGATRHLARCDYHGRWIEWLAE